MIVAGVDYIWVLVLGGCWFDFGLCSGVWRDGFVKCFCGGLLVRVSRIVSWCGVGVVQVSVMWFEADDC